MNHRQFDHLIREKLQDHESMVPDNMWNRIATGEQRRGGWLRRLSMLVAVLALPGAASLWLALNIPPNKTSVFNPENDTVKYSAAPKRNKPYLNITPDINTERDKATELAAGNSLPEKDAKSKAQKTAHAKQRYVRHKNKKHLNNTGIDTALPAIMYDSNARSEQPARPSDTGTAAPPQAIQKLQQSKDSTSVATTESVGEPDRFSLEVFASPDALFNGINASDKTYEQALKNNMRPGFSYTAGLRFRYAFSESVFFKIGVQYTAINTHGYHTDSVLLQQRSHNKYRFIGVPLLAGYATRLPGKVAWGVNAGVVVSIHSKYKGPVPLQTGGFADARKEPIYNTNVHAAFYLGTDFSKRIKNRTDIFVEPWLLYRHKNRVARFYGFEQHLHTAGLSLGVRYKLYKNQ